MSDRRWKLFCFDLDGTLIRGTSSQHLADRLGHGAELAQLEARYAANEISNREVADRSAYHFIGHSRTEIVALMQSVPLISGIEATLKMLSAKGVPSLLTTVTWRFASEAIARRFGFADWSGVEMSDDARGALSGLITRYFDEYDKRDFVAAFCAANGIESANVVAVGDSRSDIPLFRWTGFSIALNASADAKAAATVALTTDNLRDVLRLVPGL